MFTGLVSDIGYVKKLVNNSTSLLLSISVNRESKLLDRVSIGDSIAVNGVCLTVVSFTNDSFSADVMNETVKRTNLSKLSVKSKVNLEKSVTLNSFLGGHIVLGDVDFVGKVKSITKDGIARLYEIEIKENYSKYIVEKGRITIDGASLTVVYINEQSLVVSLIPHTQSSITLGEKNVGDLVNIEVDIIAKHIEKLISFDSSSKGLSISILMENGFI